MDSPTEELATTPATYVPEPFQGLPAVFGEDDAESRGWRHRPARGARRRKNDAAALLVDEPLPAATPVTAVVEPPARNGSRHASRHVSSRDVPSQPGVEERVIAAVAELLAAPPAPPASPEPAAAEVAATRAPRAVVDVAELPPSPPPVVAPPAPPRVEATPPPPPPVVAPPPPVVVPASTPSRAETAPPRVVVEAAPPAPLAPRAVVPPPAPPIVVAPPLVVAPPQPPKPAPKAAPVTPAPATPSVFAARAAAAAAARPAAPEPAAPETAAPETSEADMSALPVHPVTGLPSYAPEPYDAKTAGAVTPAADILQLYGVVLHRRRSRGARVMLVLLLAVLAGVGFFAWRQLQHSKTGPAHDVVYHSAAGHFSARFPTAPTESNSTMRFKGERASFHFVTDPADHVGLASFELSQAIPATATDQVLLSASRGLGTRGTLILAHQHRTTFHGRPALEGEFWAGDGSTVAFLGTVYSPHRIYVLLAPSGPSYDNLRASFVAQP